jgi:predicted Zn finger-like uncharacterized protein
MLVNCDSCQKKFSVPDSAITVAGRLLQCGSCGNKWVQHPIKTKLFEKIKKITPVKIKQIPSINRIKKTVKKKREISLYSEEYLQKKHGLQIKNSIDNKRVKNNSNMKTGWSFYSYLIIISVFMIGLFGVLNLTKDLIIAKHPGTELYINQLYEFFDIIIFTLSSFIV